MRQSHRQRDTWFDDWLDARVAGRSTPAPDAASLDETDRAAVHAAMAAAGQVHGLPGPARPNDDEAARRVVWETIMQQQPTTNTGMHPSGGFALDPTFAGRTETYRPPIDRRIPWAGALSAVMAAALLIALIAGFRGFDGRDSGGGEQIPFAAAGGTPPSPEHATAVAQVIPDDDEAFMARPSLCTTAPLTKQQVLDELAARPSSISQRSVRTQQPEQRTVTNNDVPALVETASQFFSCLAQDKPMSALALTNATFKKNWITSQVALTHGYLNDALIVAFVDDLAARQAAADANPLPVETDAGNYLPAFRLTGAMETTDGRVHLIVNWISDIGQQDTAALLDQAPNHVTLAQDEDGTWLIDRVSFDIYGG